MKKNLNITLLILLLCCGVQAFYAQNLTNVMSMPYPTAVKYLPPPPDSLSMAYSWDVHQYMYYKTLRDTERGQQALIDVNYGSIYVAQRMEEIFGLNVTSPKYPSIRNMFNTAINYISQACGAAKTYYNRQRPFDRFNDQLFSSESASTLSKQGSYPSAHSMMGWAAALLLAEINPELQDQLYECGYEYGLSRLIIGAHWQSDVDAARMMTSAMFARLHANDDFMAMVGAAQASYDSITHHERPLSLDQQHKFVRFLPQMPDSTTAAFANDVTRYYENKKLRDSERGQQAQADDDLTVTGLSNAFSAMLGINITMQETPALYSLVEKVLTHTSDNCLALQQENARTAPYTRLNDELQPGTSASSVSSYPSCHAAVGWAVSLALMDVCPTFQNEILLRGRQYGQSRVITGANWQSDVDAGQMLGGMVFANLVSDPTFRQLLSQARQEFNAVSSVTAIENSPSVDAVHHYTLDGRCATPGTHGIVVSSNGKKEIR